MRPSDSTTKVFFPLARLALAAVALCAGVRPIDAAAQATLQISSPAFASGREIPAKYTCRGANASPPLAWSGVPPGTVTLALVVDDPDAPDPAAPKKTWVHWVAFGLAPESGGLPEGAGNGPASAPAKYAANDFRKLGYGGPCPPLGRHRYFFKLYALDSAPSPEPADKAALEKAMEGHILAQAQLVGTFEAQK